MGEITVKVPASADKALVATMAALANAQVKVMLSNFKYDHLPAPLRKVSKPICDLAHSMAVSLEPGSELIHGLRKLLEAKDCFVRAALPVPKDGE